MRAAHWIALLVAWPLVLGAAALPRQSAVPGGLAHVAVGERPAPAPSVWYEGRRALVVAQGQRWLALVGIPLGAKPGRHEVSVEDAKTVRRVAFTVQPKSYPAQHLRLANQRMVEPSAEDLERIAADRACIDTVLATWSALDSVQTSFLAPVRGRLSSRFGLRRFFNGQAKSPHGGVDLAAPAGTPVKAPARARVIGTGEYYFNGRSVFLDHGQGLISAYFHLSEIRVRQGQELAQGEVLGTVGATGRATGPHLHWSTYLNRAQVDPALFVAGGLR